MPHENVYKDDEGQEFTLPENLVISYSSKRAAKDRKDRDRLVKKAKKLLENPENINSLNKRGGKKYIDRVNPKNTETWRLAVEKIEKDAEFDGYFGIQTSEKEMTAADVMDAYHTLWKIEESFRIMKSTMEVKPIYHWTPKRIKGHFVLCFLAFLMERTMEIMLKDEVDEVNSSPEKIQAALNTMQLAFVTTEMGEIYIKAKPEPLANKIFRLLKINTPANINSKQELIEKFCLNVEAQPTQMTLFSPLT